MATLRDIKRRIKGVKSTQQITKAMKMVAAARLKRAQDNIINARPYSQKMKEMLGDLLRIEKNFQNPLLQSRKVEKIAVILLTSDRGLCGSFNMNVIRNVEHRIKSDLSSFYDEENLDIYCIGKKGVDYFKANDIRVREKHLGVFSNLKYDFAAQFVTEMANKYVSGEVDQVYIVYNKFKSVIQQELTFEQLIPVKPMEDILERKDAEFIYEPDMKQIIGSLVPRHLKTQMWTALLDSYAAELGARMTAMDMATENAADMIKDLQLKYNKERQAAITKEILEIVSGANALKGS